MDLKTLSADKILLLLNEETIELVVKSYLNNNKDVISWLRYIDNLFDNLCNIGDMGDNYLDCDILSDDYMAALYEFVDVFPQFVNECKYDTQKLYDYLDNKIKDKNHIHINGTKHRVIF